MPVVIQSLINHLFFYLGQIPGLLSQNFLIYIKNTDIGAKVMSHEDGAYLITKLRLVID